MTLTDAQKQALERLPITFDYADLKTTDGVQWRTIEKLKEQGLVEERRERRENGEPVHQVIISATRRGRGG